MTVELRNATNTLPAILSKLQKCHSFNNLKSLYAAMVKSNTHQHPFSMNQFLAACSRARRMDLAVPAFALMSDPNAFVYNAVIGGLVESSAPERALHLFAEMPQRGLRPTRHTFSHLVKACRQAHAAGLGEALHGQIRKMGFADEVVLQTGLIDFYAGLKRVCELRRVFDEMCVRDAFAWNTAVQALACVGETDEARSLFDVMPDKNPVSWNVMIGAYAKAGDVESAGCLFSRMPVKSLVSWTSMISCYSRNGRFKEAIDTFERMKAVGVTPDGVTMAAVISACAHLGALEVGSNVHRYAMLNGFELDVYTGSALIDMFAKCGSLERSLVVFFKLEEKNLFCWNSIIDGLAIHGRGKDALDMFDRMTDVARLEPNGVSFVSVLSACTHSGLVNEGREMFRRMRVEYSISPELEHYCCIVDLLGRAGLIDEALETVRSMETEPNAVIWRALLGACRIHGNVEVGEVAMESLLAMEPDASSNYVMLVNMYARVDRWEEVASARRTMRQREREMQRSPGRSWINHDDAVHEFAAADTSHPSFDRIYSMTVALDAQLKLAGYVREWSFGYEF